METSHIFSHIGSMYLVVHYMYHIMDTQMTHTQIDGILIVVLDSCVWLFAGYWMFSGCSESNRLVTSIF